jgi:hypothetical protein
VTKQTELSVCELEQGATYTFEVRTVTADGRSEPLKSDEVLVTSANVSSKWRITSWVATGLAIAATLVMLILWALGAGGHASTFRPLTLAFGVVALAALALTAVGKSTYGLWRMIIGRDHRVSTSYVTTALWTWLLAFLLAYFTARTWFDGEEDMFTGVQPGSDSTSVWDDYLVLIGGPFAALIFARGLVSAKVSDQSIQKTVADDGTANLRQALTADDNAISLVDSQYLIFNVVAFVYIIVGLASTNRLPAVPGLLMALTGSAAATYVLNKAVQRSAPSISSVVPSSFRPGEQVVIHGTNFRGDGSALTPAVTIAGRSAVVDAEGSSSARVHIVVPAGVPAGTQDLVVTTSARVSTEPRSVVVLEDHPTIFSVDPPYDARIGLPVAIEGLGFTSALDPGKTVIAFFGTVGVSCIPSRSATGNECLEVAVPGGVPTGTPIDVKSARPA